MPEESVLIHDLPVEERPRERLQQFGPEALSAAELLAILLRVGTAGESVVRMAERLLRDLAGLTGIAGAPLQKLAAQRGLGLAKGAQLKAAFELGRRVARAEHTSQPLLNNARAAAALTMEELRYLKQERLLALLLDTRSQLLRPVTVTQGTLSGSPAHPREVFREAIAYSAAALILVHNHPSGDPTPSRDDIALTERLARAGELLGIPLLDHIIIGDGIYVSLKEAGKM